ncbi:hypothetical protein [Nitrospira sp. Kam-Ns4a]
MVRSMAELKAFLTTVSARRGARPAFSPDEASLHRLALPSWRTVLAAPLLYAMIVPLVMLDLSLELYHRAVFRLLGIPFVRRRDYIRIDRHRLPYLSAVQKLACAYCGYANGLLQYAARIAGETEAYFCPSKHQATEGFHPPPHHERFAEYGDAGGFRRLLEQARRAAGR